MNRDTYNPTKEKICCEGCGRDAAASSGLCNECRIGERRRNSPPTGRSHSEWLHFERDVD